MFVHRSLVPGQRDALSFRIVREIIVKLSPGIFLVIEGNVVNTLREQFLFATVGSFRDDQRTTEQGLEQPEMDGVSHWEFYDDLRTRIDTRHFALQVVTLLIHSIAAAERLNDSPA